MTYQRRVTAGRLRPGRAHGRAPARSAAGASPGSPPGVGYRICNHPSWLSPTVSSFKGFAHTAKPLRSQGCHVRHAQHTTKAGRCVQCGTYCCRDAPAKRTPGTAHRPWRRPAMQGCPGVPRRAFGSFLRRWAARLGTKAPRPSCLPKTHSLCS